MGCNLMRSVGNFWRSSCFPLNFPALYPPMRLRGNDRRTRILSYNIVYIFRKCWVYRYLLFSSLGDRQIIVKVMYYINFFYLETIWSGKMNHMKNLFPFVISKHYDNFLSLSWIVKQITATPNFFETPYF